MNKKVVSGLVLVAVVLLSLVPATSVLADSCSTRNISSGWVYGFQDRSGNLVVVEYDPYQYDPAARYWINGEFQGYYLMEAGYIRLARGLTLEFENDLRPNVYRGGQMEYRMVPAVEYCGSWSFVGSQRARN